MKFWFYFFVGIDPFLGAQIYLLINKTGQKWIQIWLEFKMDFDEITD
jgi:hypothetical protein